MREPENTSHNSIQMILGQVQSSYASLLAYYENRKILFDHPLFKRYLDMMGIADKSLVNADHLDIISEAFYNNPEMSEYLLRLIKQIKRGREDHDKLTFLDSFSEEQIKYITYPSLAPTKMIACAGSGKTRSIIGRIRFLSVHHLVKPENIYMITFSRHAAEDFRNKVKALLPNHANICCIKNFSTIDSLAKSILIHVSDRNSNSLEVLSIALRNYLKNATDAEIKRIKKLKNIKCLFVDEAQDLNNIQYDIIMLLQKRFGTIVSLVGDPNQNIYQFRRSNSSYLMGFSGKIFHLTLNFRSTSQIIAFSEGLRPVKSLPSRSANNIQGPPVLIATKDSKQAHQFILEFIKIYGREKDISEIAIICPTRGIKSYASVGLSVFFNLLTINKIRFRQMYDESGRSDERKKNVEKIPGHVNLSTYHGVKGLEFDVVFVMDFYQPLFNIIPTAEEHATNQYLLYVAASRAISQMYLFTYSNTHGGAFNHWITEVDPTTYYQDSPIVLPRLEYRDKSFLIQEHGITTLLSELTDEDMLEIRDCLGVEEEINFCTTRIFQDFSQIDRCQDEALFGTFCEELFHWQYMLASWDPIGARSPYRRPMRELSVIEYILKFSMIIVDNDRDANLLRQQIEGTRMTWAEYDQISPSLSRHLTELVNRHFRRDQELSECIICTNEFATLIDINRESIEKCYQGYQDPMFYSCSYKAYLKEFFYLIVVIYAYHNNHYCYMNNRAEAKMGLLVNGAELFEAINQYAVTLQREVEIDPKVLVKYPKTMMVGEIDYIEKNGEYETIVDIKCVKELSFKYYLQLFLYNFCYYHQNDISKLYCNNFKIVNFLTGLEHCLIIRLKPEKLFRIIMLVSKKGNLTFNEMNLVYDLETTGKIGEEQEARDKSSIPPRAVARYRGNGLWSYRTLPKITEIAIKDYDTGMMIVNQLINPEMPLTEEAVQITGITDAMIHDQPTIDSFKPVLMDILSMMVKPKMIAHGGAFFDETILCFEKIIEPSKVIMLDSLQIIPLNLPPGIKPDSMKLGVIYRTLFGKDFPAHRAMTDVDALIAIMKKLGIRF
jgi:DNA polymerase III epsilon subunit-like protein